MKYGLYVVTHKKLDNSFENRITIGVGPNKNSIGADFCDDSGDNISSKNKNYCELTALYWIWKNTSNDIVGLEHYRRVFINNKKILNDEIIKKCLEKKDIILASRVFFKCSTYKNYCLNHYKEDLVVVERIIKDICPNYLNSFKKLKKINYLYPYNMFISKKDIIDNYCSWLFPILFKLENEIDLSFRDDYQSRVFGFISERLFTLWVIHNKLRIKETKVSYEMEFKNNRFSAVITWFFKRIIRYNEKI